MAENIPVTNDLVFQSIFGKVGNERITKGFLEKVLGIEIEDLTLDTNKRLIGEEIDDKRNRLDVKAILKDGTKVFIEMQVEAYDYMPKRMVFYCSKVYTEGLKMGKSYDEIKKTIGILIMQKNLNKLKEIKKYHTVWSLREKDNPEVELTDEFVIHVIELEKFGEDAKGEEEYDWIKFVKEGVNMGEPLKYDKMLEEAIEELDRLLADEETRERYEGRIDYLRDQISAMTETKRKAEAEGMAEGLEKGMEKGMKKGMEKGMKKGMKKGIEKGIAQNQKEVILNMYKEGADIEFICKVVKLSREEVEKVLN